MNLSVIDFYFCRLHNSRGWILFIPGIVPKTVSVEIIVWSEIWFRAVAA
jgi:hypothetical protein